MRIVPARRELCEDAARLRAETGLKLADALHAATALRAGCESSSPMTPTSAVLTACPPPSWTIYFETALCVRPLR